jgi:vacuolar-type H+-ATPase subunit I/STV1
MIIVVLNLAQMDQAEGQTPEEILRAQEWMAITKQQEKEREELDTLKNLIEKMIQENRDVIAKREKLLRLKDLKENTEEIDKSRNELIAKINALQRAIEQFDKQYPEITKQIEELMAELKRRELPPDPPRLRVRPSGSGTSAFPFFVEAANNALLIHQSLTEEPVVIPTAALGQNEAFVDLLKLVSGKRTNRLIFLVRGSKESAKTYNAAANLINTYNEQNKSDQRFNRILPGRLPLPAQGKVDLTPFAQYLRK